MVAKSLLDKYFHLLTPSLSLPPLFPRLYCGMEKKGQFYLYPHDLIHKNIVAYE